MTEFKTGERDGLFYYETTHRLFYNTKNPVPIAEVITALQGLQAVLKPLQRAVEEFTGSEIALAEYELSRLETGSLWEDIGVKLFFENQADLDAFIKKIRENKKMRNALVGTLIVGIIGYGIYSLAKTSPSPTPNVTISNNVIINYGAAQTGVTPERFSEIIAAAVDDKKALAEGVAKVLKPSRADPASSLSITGDDVKMEIPAESIVETPAVLDLGKNERFEKFKKVKLEIRATDLDSKKTGWAGKLGTREERLKIELAPSVVEADLIGKSIFTVDATLVFSAKGKHGELKPSRIHVEKVYK